MNSQERVAQLTPEEAASPQHPVTPLAARLARDRGVNLSQVPASGERIRRQDVDNDLAGPAAPMATALAATRAAATPAALKPPISLAPVIVGGDKLPPCLPI